MQVFLINSASFLGVTAKKGSLPGGTAKTFHLQVVTELGQI